MLRVASGLVLSLLVLLPLAVEASRANHSQYIQGEVIAVNTSDTPQVIVLRTFTSTNKELIVGATVDSDVTIKRGTQPVRLSEIRVGDKVAMTYVKTLEGLVARSIKAR